MNYSNEEKKLIIALRSSSPTADGDEVFKEELLQKILAQGENKKSRGKFNLSIINFLMRKESIAMMFILVFLVATLSAGVGAGVGYTVGRRQDGQDESINIIPETDGVDEDSSGAAGDPAGDESMSSSIAMETMPSITEAQENVTFDIFLPTSKIGSEKVGDINISTDFIDGTKEDSIYINYDANGETLYKVSAMKNSAGLVDEGGTDVKVNGARAIYMKFSAEEGAIPNSLEPEYVSPNSYLVWMIGDVRYDISEFGDLSQEELIKLAESFEKV